ncbi:MAG: exodeoxyribonuclease VII small subunit [Anaerolineae bacterium]|jgi:exodeoxyribonuclease VII small subunit|nr:exodeoxyribonuclease VII small subunit [Anaerolineae bacterium]
MNDKDEKSIQSLTFEEAYNQLEETVRQLEAGNLPLAEALSLYQRGMALAKHCGLELDNAELTIKRLMPGGDLADFDELES